MGTLNQISAVIFDMDGTLHDTEIVFHNATKAGVAAVGHSVSDAFCHSLLGLPGSDGDVLLREHLGPNFPYSEYIVHYRAHVSRILASAIPLKPGAVEIAKFLVKRDVKVAVATSADRSRAEHQLRLSGLGAHIPIIVTRDDVDRAKPHPDLFLRAAALLNVPVGHCLAIEDSFNGIRSAYAAGTMPVMVPDLVSPTDEIRALCVHVASSLHDVKEWLVAQDRQPPSA